MPTSKLTLSIDKRLIVKAKRLARARNTSVSAMFSRYIEAVSGGGKRKPAELGPKTRRALGIAKNSRGRPDRDLVEEALIEKYGLDR